MITNKLTIDTTSNVNDNIALDTNITVQQSSNLLSGLLSPLFSQKEVIFEREEDLAKGDNKEQSNKSNEDNNNNSSTMHGYYYNSNVRICM